ncbi:MAG: hypothetical protein NTY53_25150 [Kiritimatiellaeota bacterium]|nr:hypothetical protein [Kiritimatiellota bacterium]
MSTEPKEVAPANPEEVTNTSSSVDPYEPLKRFTKEDLKKYLEANPKEEPSTTSTDDPHEPLKRFTKADLRKYLDSVESAPEPAATTSAGDAPAKLALAPLVESDHDISKKKQDFPRSFATKPCKPNCDPDPKAHIIAVVLIIVCFVGMAAYLVIKREQERSKPHPIPKNMPMRVLGGQLTNQP